MAFVMISRIAVIPKIISGRRGVGRGHRLRQQLLRQRRGLPWRGVYCIKLVLFVTRMFFLFIPGKLFQPSIILENKAVTHQNYHLYSWDIYCNYLQQNTTLTLAFNIWSLQNNLVQFENIAGELTLSWWFAKITRDLLSACCSSWLCLQLFG